ncbi:hypothetical protein DAEQUDRAFT_266167 [Daedalea quercina L-15889]|uniref:Uncharacterized protein n=1 Tax=Daedalea quercina L-15889 TaxID=1314783 RepID=A0A165QGG7_9APHY|nr:hypothetical protein DAEQUDRAFT_266167 [Daedalea quercina L-15889]
MSRPKRLSALGRTVRTGRNLTAVQMTCSHRLLRISGDWVLSRSCETLTAAYFLATRSQFKLQSRCVAHYQNTEGLHRSKSKQVVSLWNLIEFEPTRRAFARVSCKEAMFLAISLFLASRSISLTVASPSPSINQWSRYALAAGSLGAPNGKYCFRSDSALQDLTQPPKDNQRHWHLFGLKRHVS